MNTTDKKQLPLKRPPKKERKRKKLRLDAAATEEGRILGQYKAHSKKPLLESVKEHLGKAIDNIDPIEALLDIATLFSFYTKYNVIDHHGNLASFAEAAVDMALLKTRTDAGVAAVLVHMGLTSLPSIANAIDSITGGPGTVWEDFLKVLGSLRLPSLGTSFPWVLP